MNFASLMKQDSKHFNGGNDDETGDVPERDAPDQDSFAR